MIYTTDIIGYQWEVLLKSVNLGVILGICYDFLRFIRTVVPFGKRLYIISDFIYFLWASFLAFSFLLNENFGIPRFYIFFGAGIGFLLWYHTFGRLSVILGRIAKRILSAVFTPLIKITGRIFESVGIRLEKRKIFCQKVIGKQKSLLKNKTGMVYNILCLNVSKAFSFCGEKAGKEPESLESNGTEKTETESFPQGRSYRLRGISSCFSDIDPGEHQFKEK